MSSREIAELTGKRHDNVMRDIRAMLVELHGESDLLRFEGVYSGGNGESRPCFNLPKRETLILISGYSIVMRARIIDRWQELEDKYGRKQSLEWQRAREEGKLSRKAETDVIEEFVEYAEAQGSSNARHYYVNITKGTYKALYLLDKSADVKNLRERLSVMQLNQLATAESVARKAIAEYMEIGTHYKDIYRIAIDRVLTLADLLGKQLPGNDSVRGIKHKEAA
jgi:Rha family phage regulatory protein